MTEKTQLASEEPKEVQPANVGNTVRASWPFSLHDIRAHIAHCSPAGKQALVDAFLWCIDPKHPITRLEFARRVDYSENVIYKLYTGKYRSPETNKQLDVPADLLKNIAEFLQLEKERHAGGKNEFVVTPTAKRIWTACDLARASQTPVFIYGVSHIGKTLALEAYSQDNNHGRSPYVRMKAASGLGGMIRRICERVGVSPNGNTAALTDELKAAITGDMVLILDEVHLLQYTYRISSFFACMEVLREIYDETKCGMILCGTKLLQDRMQQGKDREMQQLIRRGVHKINLPDMPTKGDIAAILQHNGLQFPGRDVSVTVQDVTESPYEVIRRLAKQSALKAITERIRYAKKIAGKANKRLSWTVFMEAHLTIESSNAHIEDWK